MCVCLCAPMAEPEAAHHPLQHNAGRPTNGSMTAGANRARRITRRACVTSMPSASAIPATDAARCSSSRRCQWRARPGARSNLRKRSPDRVSPGVWGSVHLHAGGHPSGVHARTIVSSRRFGRAAHRDPAYSLPRRGAFAAMHRRSQQDWLQLTGATTLQLMGGSGHCVQRDRPDAVAGAVRELLQSPA